MKSKYFWLIILAGLIITNLVASSKHYSISAVNIQAKLDIDGSMIVEESRTYDFSGTFTFAYRYFPVNGPVRFSDFSLREVNQDYFPSDTRQPGTYEITEDSDKIEIRWFYLARDEERIFTLRYHVDDAVVNYSDAAVVYYKFISEDWKITQKQIVVELFPPDPVSRNLIFHWLHGPLWAESTITPEGIITARTAWLPSGSFFEIRALYPPEIFPDAEKIDQEIKTDIIDQEAQWANESDLERERFLQQEIDKNKRKQYGANLFPIISLVFFFLWVLIYKTFCSRKATPDSSYGRFEPPENLPPALLNYLMSFRGTAPVAFSSTLIDLAERGFLLFRELDDPRRKNKKIYQLEFLESIYEQQKNELMPFEKSLLEYLFIDNQRENNILDLNKLTKERNRFSRFFRRWQKQIRLSAETRNWFDLRSIKGSYYSLVLGLIAFICGLAGIWYYGEWSLLLVLSGIIISILSTLIPHRTEIGARELSNWKAYRKFLRQAVRSGEIKLNPDQLSRALIYGVLFNIQKEFLNTALSGTAGSDLSGNFIWFISSDNSSKGMVNSITNLISVTNSTLSSASGTGGGATSGGGGGAGSGGGGAG
ncbi:MAG: DUF2207 domain-containing protein [Candidatus Cloacimonetes bacterium]|nr:DUF2207 domain-containing protein [Candidatus Cloacimonadota bacterium]